MKHAHSHTRKPEPVQAWQFNGRTGEPLPDWAKEGGITQQMLDNRELPIGHWLVRNERRGTILAMNPVQFEAEYDAI